MLQLTANSSMVEQSTTDVLPYNNCYPDYPTTYPSTYWLNYPIYITTDKTKKAIEILKALQNDKLIECRSVSKFIELVEKIYNLL